MAQSVASEIQSQPPELGTVLSPELPVFEITQPLSYADWKLPPSPEHSTVPPLGD